jgi:hypothetical protein
MSVYVTRALKLINYREDNTLHEIKIHDKFKLRRVIPVGLGGWG